MMLRVILPVVLFIGVNAFGGTHSIPSIEPAGTIRLPDDWKVTSEGELTQAISRDGLVRFVIVHIEHGKGAEAMGEVMDYIRNVVRLNVQADSMRSEKRSLKGHEAHFITWQATDNHDKIEVHYVIFSIAPNNGWLAAYWGKPDALQRYQPALDRAIQSVKPSAAQQD